MGNTVLRKANHTIMIWTSLFISTLPMQYFLQQSCSFWFIWNGSRQLLAEGLHHVAGHVLRRWLHKQSCLQKLVFHLPQNLDCHHVKGQSQWRAGIPHSQDVCCHLYRRKPSQDKLKNATAKCYHLKAKQTWFVQAQLHFSCRDGNPRPCSSCLSPAAPG